MRNDGYILSPVNTTEQWRTYHNIRRRILWENRGIFGEYQEDHPDERKPENHPMLLLLYKEPIGVVRIDIDKNSGQAIMRRVAITEEKQRKGHGRRLVELVEEFAVNKGCGRIIVASAEDARIFYKKCGYRPVSQCGKEMVKDMIKKNC